MKRLAIVSAACTVLALGESAVMAGSAPSVKELPADAKKLLAPFRDRIKRIVFTKHFDMGGSHYAYTDAISNEDTLNPTGTVKEFNFKGGSSLCLLEIGEDYAVKETRLLHDEDGVFRDPKLGTVTYFCTREPIGNR